MKNDYSFCAKKTATALILFVLLLLPVYANTFKASWQFDDKPNIVDNELLHIDNLSPGSLWQTFFARAGRKAFYRPVPNLTFALNWYFGQEDTFGYHLVNVIVHILTAFFLYLAVNVLLHAPNVKDKYTDDEAHFIALLSAALWAINPVQIQAVTYIVQRMASMAAMFYILSIYWYLKGRLEEKIKQRMLFWGVSCIGFICALMSKENAAILPLSLILIEIVFFRDLSPPRKSKNHLPLLFAMGVVIILLAIPMSQNIKYGTRPFTLVERLLTEPRILLLYLSQIFYPLPDRLSITHDIVVSTSLLSPWTTLPSILIILMIICIAIFKLRKTPLAAFAVLFFFLNHVVESTVIPLELIFEHRNYLPSFFLFLPIAAGVKYILNLYKKSNRFMHAIVSGFVILALVGLGCFTYIRNQAWRTETSLWRDAMKKAPRDARPVVNLAIQIAWGEDPSLRDYDVALALFKKAIALQKAHTYLDADVLENMGLIYFEKGEYHKAVQVLKKTLQMNPIFLKARYSLIGSLVMLGQWDEASEHADWLLNNPKKYFKSEYFNIKGFILLWQKRPHEALPYFTESLRRNQDNNSALLNAGVASSLIGKSEAAEFFLNKALHGASEDIRSFLALIEHDVRVGNLAEAEHHTQQLFDQFSVQEIIQGLDTLSNNYRTAPLEKALVVPVIRDKLLQISKDINQLAPENIETSLHGGESL